MWIGTKLLEETETVLVNSSVKTTDGLVWKRKKLINSELKSGACVLSWYGVRGRSRVQAHIRTSSKYLGAKVEIPSPVRSVEIPSDPPQNKGWTEHVCTATGRSDCNKRMHLHTDLNGLAYEFIISGYFICTAVLPIQPQFPSLSSPLVSHSSAAASFLLCDPVWGAGSWSDVDLKPGGVPCAQKHSHWMLLTLQLLPDTAALSLPGSKCWGKRS